MDGIRAYWDGERLWSRLGNEIKAPSKLLQSLPRGIALDGELWMGRGTFETLLAILRSSHQDWSKIQYCIFDLPSSPERYEQRMKQLQQIRFPPQTRVVSHSICQGIEDLMERLDLVLKGGGEGLIMNDPHAYYVPDRTNSIVKVKVCV